jgi:molybdopterin/thiamine biosynthesis adenylyltransferase
MKGLGGEIAKNLVLGGISSITILDDGKVTAEDLQMNFLIDRSSLGKNVKNLLNLKKSLKIRLFCVLYFRKLNRVLKIYKY